MEFLLPVILLSATLAYFLFGLFTLGINPRSAANRLFFLVCMMFALWAVCHVFLQSASTGENVRFWYRLSSVGAVFFTGFLAHFFLVFTGGCGECRTFLRRLLYGFFYGPAVFFVWAALAGRFTVEDFVVIRGAWVGVLSRPGPYFAAYTAWYNLLIIFSFALMLRWRAKSADRDEKNQARIILIYGITAYLLVSAGYLALALRGYRFPSIGILIPLLWIYGIWRAMTGYGMLGITPKKALGAILESIHDALLLAGPDGVIAWANPAAAKLTGRGRRELKGMKTGDIIRRITREDPWRRGTSLPGEVGVMHRDGTESPALLAESQIIIGGASSGRVLSLRDISGLKEAEEALRESEERFRDIAEASGEYIWETDAEFRHTYISDRVTEISGIPKEEIIGKTPFDFMPPEDARKLKAFIESTLKAGKRSGEAEVRFIRADGAKAWIEIRGVAVFGEDGRVKGFRGTSRDITGRKENEIRLKALSGERTFLLNGITSHIWYMKDERTYGFANRAHISFLGLKIEDADGKNIFEILPPDDAREMAESNRKAFTEKKKVVTEQWITNAEGDKRLLGMTKLPHLDEAGRVDTLLCTAADITDKRIAEDKIRETLKLKSDFISMVSHELRTPMAIIKEGVAIVAEGVAGELNPEQAKLLGAVTRNVERLSMLITSVLDFQKLDSGREKLNLKEGDINETVKEAVELFKAGAESKGIGLSAELEEKIPRFAFDSDKIMQALVNLIDNAVKFTGEGSVSVKTSLERPGLVKITVADTGAGIGDADPATIFEMFEQGGDVLRSKPSGVGLGLPITRRIINLHGGGIRAEPAPGGGTVFSFTLPALPARIACQNR